METNPRSLVPNPLAGVPCVKCGALALRVEARDELVARPIGTYSLAGAQLKTSVVERSWPWAVCDGCGGESRGKL